MAPEVMCGYSHTGSVDFFAVGVITYELMYGKRPYIGKNRKEIKEKIISQQIFIKKENIPDGWSEDAADFINRLLVRKDIERLGYYNDLDIKKHCWLKNINFEDIVDKKIQAPFLPKKYHDNYDKNYCEEIEIIGIDTMNRYEIYKRNENFEDLFCGFTYYNDEKEYYDSLVKMGRDKYYNNVLKNDRNSKIKKYKTIDIEGKNLNYINSNADVDNKKTMSINVDGFSNRGKIKLINKKYINLKPNILYLLEKNKTVNEQKKQKEKENEINQINKNSNIIGQQLINNYNPSLTKKNLCSDITKNIINSYHDKKQKRKENAKFSEQKKTVHLHAGSFSNNLYLNILNQLELSSIDNNKNNDYNTLNQKKGKNSYIKTPLLLNCFNEESNKKINNNKTNNKYDIIDIPENKATNYHNKISLKKDLSMFYSIENETLSIINEPNNKTTNKKIFSQHSTNFYPKNTSQKILVNIKDNFDTIKIDDNNDETDINHSRRVFQKKVRRKNNSGVLKINHSFGKIKIKNELSSSKSKKKNSCQNSSNKLKTGLFIGGKKTINYDLIKHNHSFSTINNILMYKKSFVKSDKNKKSTIPVKSKNSLNSISNSKINSIAHKKIPLPSLGFTKKNSFSDFYENNTNNNLTNKTTKNSLYNSKLSNNSTNSKDKYSTIGTNNNLNNSKKKTNILKKLCDFSTLSKNSFNNLNKTKMVIRKNSKTNCSKKDKNLILKKKILEENTKKIFAKRINNNINNTTNLINKKHKNNVGTFSNHSFNTTTSSKLQSK